MTQVAIPKGKVAEASAPVERKRVLGLGSSTALVVGNMIGSGIFLLPSSLAAYGGISIVGWLFTAAGAMCLALLPRFRQPGEYIQLHHSAGNVDDTGSLLLLRDVGTHDLYQAS